MLVPWIHIIWNIKNVTFELSCIRIDCSNSGVTYRTHRRWSKVKNYYGNKNSRKIIIHRKVKISLSIHKITHISKSVDKGPQICWTILVERIVVVERILKASERRPPLGLSQLRIVAGDYYGHLRICS